MVIEGWWEGAIGERDVWVAEVLMGRVLGWTMVDLLEEAGMDPLMGGRVRVDDSCRLYRNGALSWEIQEIN